MGEGRDVMLISQWIQYVFISPAYIDCYVTRTYYDLIFPFTSTFFKKVVVGDGLDHLFNVPFLRTETTKH